MRIELLTVYSTLRRAYQPGDTIDLPESEAIGLIKRELAKPVRESKTELAIRPQGEQTVQQRGRTELRRKDKRQ